MGLNFSSDSSSAVYDGVTAGAGRGSEPHASPVHGLCEWRGGGGHCCCQTGTCVPGQRFCHDADGRPRGRCSPLGGQGGAERTRGRERNWLLWVPRGPPPEWLRKGGLGAADKPPRSLWDSRAAGPPSTRFSTYAYDDNGQLFDVFEGGGLLSGIVITAAGCHVVRARATGTGPPTIWGEGSLPDASGTRLDTEAGNTVLSKKTDGGWGERPKPLAASFSRVPATVAQTLFRTPAHLRKTGLASPQALLFPPVPSRNCCRQL